MRSPPSVAAPTRKANALSPSITVRVNSALRSAAACSAASLASCSSASPLSLGQQSDLVPQ